MKTCCLSSLYGYRYLGDGGIDRREFCIMVHIGPEQVFSPLEGGTSGAPNPKFWA